MKQIWFGILIGLLFAGTLQCVNIPKLQPDGKISGTESVVPLPGRIKDKVNALLKSKGFAKPIDHEADFWKNLILGVGMSFGGVLIVGGVLVVVFSELTRWKLGGLSVASGGIIMVCCYFLMKYMWLLCAIAGASVLISIGLLVYYLAHNREVLRKVFWTTEIVKDLPEWKDPGKDAIRTFQGKHQPYIKKLKNKIIK